MNLGAFWTSSSPAVLLTKSLKVPQDYKLITHYFSYNLFLFKILFWVFLPLFDRTDKAWNRARWHAWVVHGAPALPGELAGTAVSSKFHVYFQETSQKISRKWIWIHRPVIKSITRFWMYKLVFAVPVNRSTVLPLRTLICHRVNDISITLILLNVLNATTFAQ